MIFLTPADVAQMRRDASDIVRSAAGMDISVRYLSGITNAVWDETYQQWVGDKTYTTTANIRAMQHFVTDRDEDLLQLGFVKVGDCIFTLLPGAFDFDDKDEVTVIDSDGVVWVPVMVPTKAFYEYMESRVGSTQLFQAILTRVKQ